MENHSRAELFRANSPSLNRSVKSWEACEGIPTEKLSPGLVKKQAETIKNLLQIIDALRGIRPSKDLFDLLPEDSAETEKAKNLAKEVLS